MSNTERIAAQSALPAGYVLVESGHVHEGDLTWDFVRSAWTPVTLAQPFVPGQKRPGSRQATDVGREVSLFVAVARSRTSINGSRSTDELEGVSDARHDRR